MKTGIIMRGLLIVVGLLVGCLLVEGGLRLLRLSWPDFYDYDPQIGARLRPGVKGYWLKEGGGYVSINSDGLRDVEHAVVKPAGTLRIAILGDSYAEAFQVDREKTFWAVMERGLRQCKPRGERKVEVINFGQSGFGTTQELLALRHRAWKYSPDVVLLAFLTGNDISDNSRALKQQDYHPYHVYHGDHLVLEDQITKDTYEKKTSLWRDFYAWRLNNFRVLQALAEGEKALARLWAREATIMAQAASNPSSEEGLLDAVYRAPVDEVWQQAWRVTEGVLLMMRDEVRARGARLVVVILSNAIQVHPQRSVREAARNRYRVPDLFYPDRRIEALCMREGIPVLTLAPRLQKYAEEEGIYLHGFGPNPGDGHWNENGHRVAGSLIAEWLCELLSGEASGDGFRGAGGG